MDDRTGEIREFQTQKEAEAAGFTVPLGRKPKASCKRCYGRGHVGRKDAGRYVPCPCTKPNKQKCRWLDCHELRDTGQLFCTQHWVRLPAAMRTRLKALTSRTQRVNKDTVWEELSNAVREAIDEMGRMYAADNRTGEISDKEHETVGEPQAN